MEPKVLESGIFFKEKQGYSRESHKYHSVSTVSTVSGGVCLCRKKLLGKLITKGILT